MAARARQAAALVKLARGALHRGRVDGGRVHTLKRFGHAPTHQRAEADKTAQFDVVLVMRLQARPVEASRSVRIEAA
jgi:hypothetical protein